ncbi:hypothetical protein DWV00_19170 [Trinickia dinghuensis]|uniref:Uncharacterized protein n=1 Tax=Trinickia dinghuensis TaxID=2291023 RepID=A0A3D8JYB5_9BURK|nr:hypothetical protein DWV00_19170 [Trinickia dinghuensis]
MSEHISATDETGNSSVKDSAAIRKAVTEGEPSLPLFFVHPIELTFYNLKSNSEAHVWLQPEGGTRWGNGEPTSKLVGVSLSASPRGSPLPLNSFLINYRNVSLVTNALCSEIRARLYVHTLDRSFSGQVDLPPGASLTIESPRDRTTLAERGISSYTLKLR